MTLQDFVRHIIKELDCRSKGQELRFRIAAPVMADWDGDGARPLPDRRG